jgi:transposase
MRPSLHNSRSSHKQPEALNWNAAPTCWLGTAPRTRTRKRPTRLRLAPDKLVPDDLWALLEPLLPPPPRPPYGGRHRTLPQRNCLAALVFMARTSTPWALLPAKELGGGSASTAWLDWSGASVDSASARHAGGTTWARIPSIAASRDPGFIWSASGTACR